MENIEWSALEYEEKERSNDWFWALGVIIIAGSIASIIFTNYFFAMLLILSGILLAFFAVKKPEMINYQINEKGLRIQNRLYRFENIKSFYVQTELPDGKEAKPTLFIKSERQFLPMLSIPIYFENAEEIKEKMLENKVAEEEMKEHVSHEIMEFFGF